MNPTKKKAISELRDLDVTRIDGVDRPAHGRSFLLFKAEDAPPANGIREFMPTVDGLDEQALDSVAARLGRLAGQVEDTRPVSPGQYFLAPDPFLKVSSGARVISTPPKPYEFVEPVVSSVPDDLGFHTPGAGGGTVSPEDFSAPAPGPIRKSASLFADVFRRPRWDENGKG